MPKHLFVHHSTVFKMPRSPARCGRLILVNRGVHRIRKEVPCRRHHKCSNSILHFRININISINHIQPIHNLRLHSNSLNTLSNDLILHQHRNELYLHPHLVSIDQENIPNLDHGIREMVAIPDLLRHLVMKDLIRHIPMDLCRCLPRYMKHEM